MYFNQHFIFWIGDNFTYAQALQEAFYYKHDGSDILEDTIEVSIQDEGQSVTLTLLMDIIEVDKQAPKPVPSATMTMMVSEGQYFLWMIIKPTRHIQVDVGPICLWSVYFRE